MKLLDLLSLLPSVFCATDVHSCTVNYWGGGWNLEENKLFVIAEIHRGEKMITREGGVLRSQVAVGKERPVGNQEA